MRVSSFWALAGLVVVGWIFADVLSHPTASAAAFNAGNQALSTTGNLVAGNFASSK